jgi:hypothetical protein
LQPCTTVVWDCEISSSHGSEYDVQSRLLGYTANILAYNDCRPTFQRCVLPPSSGIVVGDCLTVEGFWLHHIHTLAYVTIAITACNLLLGKKKKKIWTVMLLWQLDLLFPVGLKDLKALLAISFP